MDEFSELIAAVQSDLTIGNESTLFPLPTVKSAINRAKRKAEGLYKWPQKEDSLRTYTESGKEFYELPDNWETDSTWKLIVDNLDYEDPLAFKDYTFEKENQFPSGKTRMWSVYGRLVFIYPTPTVTAISPNKNIIVFGEKVLPSLVEDDDTTIFSQSMPICNEAIVLEAIAILKNKGDIVQPIMRAFVGGTQLLSIESQNLLRTAWDKLRMNQQKYEKTKPMFDVPDFFKTRNVSGKDTNIGKF